MKIRALANGDVIDVSEETAKELIDGGIYEPVDESTSSTKVGPMTTKNVPPLAKKAR